MSPEQPIIWAELGFVQRLAGDSAAIESFQQAAKNPLPAMFGVRVYYHLARAYTEAGKTEESAIATGKMLSARRGIEAWKALQTEMAGTVYGQSLGYEIHDIEKAIEDAAAIMGANEWGY
jgi:hypothetical protein